MEPPKWLNEVATFYDQLSPADNGIVVSLIDHDWKTKQKFLDSLVDHIGRTQ